MAGSLQILSSLSFQTRFEPSFERIFLFCCTVPSARTFRILCVSSSEAVLNIHIISSFELSIFLFKLNFYVTLKPNDPSPTVHNRGVWPKNPSLVLDPASRLSRDGRVEESARSPQARSGTGLVPILCQHIRSKTIPMSYKRFFAGIVLLAFFVPCVSFAQTTTPTTYSPQYIALLQQLLSLLEQELAAIQATNAPANTTATSTPSITAATTASLFPQFTSAIASVSSECNGSYQGKCTCYMRIR